jgi:hypothetical protein
MDEIIDAFYCCVILHNAAVKKRVALDDDETESESMYDSVSEEDNDMQQCEP